MPIEYVGYFFWDRIAGRSLVREFIRLICFALVGKIFFKVFHRTLEFNLLLPISLIIASFFGFFNKSYYFVSSSIRPFWRSFLSRSCSLIALRISSKSHDGFFIDLTLTDLSGACQSTTSSTRASQVVNISSGSLSKVSRTVHGLVLHLNL